MSDRPPGRFRLRRILFLAVVLVGAWMAACAVTLVRAGQRLRVGTAAVGRARHETTTADLAADRPAGDLRHAVDEFEQAHSLLSEPWLAPLRVVPYGGRQLLSARDLALAAHTVTLAGSHTLDQAHRLLRVRGATPSQRLALVRELSRTVTSLSRRVAQVDLGPQRALLPILASKRATFASDLTKLRTDLTRTTGATAALGDLLGGPRSYLVLAGNNAEMRDGSGMFLEVGTVSGRDGSLTPGPFTPTDQLVNLATTVPLGGDLERLWGSLRPNADWRNLGLSPQFPANAALAVQMWQAQTGQHVDGVLALDVEGLRDLLAATGPVSASGTTIDAGNATATLLMQQYVGLGVEQAANDVRHEQLGALASAVLGALQQPGVSLAALGTGVARATDGRHLLAWAAAPAIQAAWADAGASGQVSGDGLLLGLANQGANKLDPYQHLTAALRTRRVGPDTTVTVSATITNQTPADLSSTSPYAAGANPGVAPGTYAGIAELDFPKAAGRATVDRGIAASGSDQTSQVLAVTVSIPPGGSTVVTWRFVLAGAHGRLEVDPSARIGPTRWSAAHAHFTDENARTVTW